MRKFFFLALFSGAGLVASAQNDTLSAITTDSAFSAPSTSIQTNAPKIKTPINRAGDHLLLQLAYNTWLNAPDSIKDHMKGLQRSANIYFMLDKPFASNPKLSVAAGLGVGVSNIYFEEMEADIISRSNVLPFISTTDAANFKKYKITTTYLELPLEFRYMGMPENPNKGLKIALGAKVGTLLSAGTKGKLRQNNSGGTTINDYTVKTKSKNYFTSTRISGTARVGYGNFSLFGAYSFSPVFKDGVAPDMNLLQVGITLSGL